MNKKYIVEMVGAFLLTFTVMTTLLSSGNGVFLPTFMLAGLTLMILAFVFGKVSGGHFNPAISIGAWSVGKLPGKDLPFYVVMQIAGAVLARMAIGYFGELSIPRTSIDKPVSVLMAEAMGAMVFGLGVASVVLAKEKLGNNSTFFIGLALMLGLVLAGSIGSVGILNPAISVGLNILAWPYLVGSVVGSLIGFNLYKYLVA